MSDQMSGPACVHKTCAHKTVVNRDNERHGRVTSEWWECKECGLRFVPVHTGGQVHVSEVGRHPDEQEKAGLKSHVADLVEGMGASLNQGPQEIFAPSMFTSGTLRPASDVSSGERTLEWWHSEVSKSLMNAATERRRLESEVDAAQLSLTSVRTDNKHLIERIAYHQGKIKTAEGKLDACEQELKIVRANDELFRGTAKTWWDEVVKLRDELKLVRADRDRFIGMGGSARIDLQPTLDQLKSDAHKDQQKINQLHEVNKELRTQLQMHDAVYSDEVNRLKLLNSDLKLTIKTESEMRHGIIESHRSNIDEKMRWVAERDEKIKTQESVIEQFRLKVGCLTSDLAVAERDEEIKDLKSQLIVSRKNHMDAVTSASSWIDKLNCAKNDIVRLESEIARSVVDRENILKSGKANQDIYRGKIDWLTQVPRLMLEWIAAKISTYEIDIAEFDKQLHTVASAPYARYPIEVEKWCKQEHIRMLNEFKSSIEDSLKRNGQ